MGETHRPLAPESPVRTESDLSLPEGLEAGAIGGLAVVLVYLVPDLLAGDWLRTPALLGGLLLSGVGPHDGLTAGGLAAVFTTLHFTAWAAAGFAASALVRLTEQRHDRGRLLAIVCGVWIAGMVGLDVLLLAEHLPAAHLWIGSVVGGLAMAAYLSWRHPAFAAAARGDGNAGAA